MGNADSMDDRTSQNIQHDLYDHSRFSKSFFGTELENELATGMGDYKPYPELMEDLFYSMYKLSPEFEEEGKVKSDYRPNRSFEQAAMESVGWEQLRPYTRLDAGASAMGAVTLGNQLLKDNKEQFNQLKQQQSQINENKQNLSQLRQELENISKMRPQSYNDKAQQQTQVNAIKKKMNQQIQQTKQLQTQAQKTQQQIATSMNSVTQKASESVKEMENFFALGIGAEAGTAQKTDIKSRLEFAKLFVQNEPFRKLLVQVGKMQRLASKKQREKTKHAMDQIDDVIQSNDLPHLVSSESLLLTDPDLEILFDKKFVESQLLTYKFSGTIEKGKGPIIACLDISGSMTGAPDVMAKAVALALVMIAHMQKREAYVILFDSEIEKEFNFPKDEPYFDKMEEMASYFSGGGTNFTPPLKRAMKLFEADPKASKADLVWITDGQAHLEEETKVNFLDMKKIKKISVFSIIIDVTYDVIQHELKAISDQLVAVKELTDTIAGDLFESI